MKIRERILALTGNNALALTTPEEAKEILIPVLREWGGNYFSHSLASEVFIEIWEYAQDRLMYMYCRQHNMPRTWKNRIFRTLSRSWTPSHLFFSRETP